MHERVNILNVYELMINAMVTRTSAESQPGLVD